MDQKGEESSVIQRARQGDQYAIQQLYESTKNYAYFVARRYVQNDDDIADILQEAYISAFSKLDTFKDGRPFKPWLHTIVTNKSLNFIKSKKNIFVSEDEIGELASDNEEMIPAAWLERAEKRRDIMRIIDGLPDGQKMAVTLFYFEGLSIAEMAVIMNVAEGTVKAHLYHGRKTIKEEVLLEEKKGNKLYGIVLISLLTQLYELEAEAAVMPDALSRVIWAKALNVLAANNVIAGSNAMTVGAAAKGSGVAAKSGVLSMGAKVGIIAFAVAVTGGGTFEYISRQEMQKEMQQEILDIQITEEQEPETESPVVTDDTAPAKRMTFEEYFGANPIDAQYAIDKEVAFSTVDIIDLCYEYADIWKGEIEWAYEHLIVFDDSYNDDLNEWRSKSDAIIQEAIDAVPSTGGGSLDRMNASGTSMQVCHDKAKEVYETLYEYDWEYTYKYFGNLSNDSLSVESAFSAGVTDVWDGSVAANFEGGSGTEADPYLINTAAQLAYLAQEVNGGNSYKSMHFKLISSIDLNNIRWSQIGTDTNIPFSGIFDGCGNTIANLNMNSTSSHIGLFGCVKSGAIKNLGIIDCNITGGGRVGGLAGVTNSQTSIAKCYVTGTVIGTSNCVGGLIGHATHTTITDSYARASVRGNQWTGGLVGIAYAHSTITKCYSAGVVNGYDCVGGFVGRIRATTVTITHCYFDTTSMDKTEGVGQGDYVGTITGLTIDEMKNSSSYTDWDFEAIWDISSTANNGYPHLKNQ